MQHIEVARFHNNDYDVIIKSGSIYYSWNRFKGRIDNNKDLHEPDETCPPSRRYAKYAASDECDLYLYDPQNNEVSLIASDGNQKRVWSNQWPVVFETNKYQICINFPHLEHNTEPRVLHVSRDVEQYFNFYPDNTGDGGKLVGDVDFLNEPGVFKLEFEFNKRGFVHHSEITFDVVSPKLDTKNNYKSILRAVNKEYEDIIFRYLTTTYQQFMRGRIHNDIVWMKAFESVVESYLRNIEIILRQPHQTIQRHSEYRQAEQIKEWTPAMEEEYAEIEAEGRLEEYYFEYSEQVSTNNTLENRFVKHTIITIGKDLARILNDLITKNTDESISPSRRLMLRDYQKRLEHLRRNPFWRNVGRFEGLSQESLVLQNRLGYQQVYSAWLKLKRGIDLYNGANCIGTLQIWEVYELWCFVKMKHMVAEILGIDRNKPEYDILVSEPKGTLLNPFTDSTLEHIVQYKYPTPDDDDYSLRADQLRAHQGDIVTLHYQHTFNRTHEDDYHIHTATTEQRPDIVLNVRKATGEIILTYLYDAKYRVVSDRNLDKEDFEIADIEEQEKLRGNNQYGADYPPASAINQMHRYRDAIYYGTKLKEHISKEIIGGYILFPGRGDDQSINKRYFSKSINDINIGAFPLLPESEGKEDLEGKQLRQHLHNILMEKRDVSEHVEKSIPQRGLSYRKEPDGVLVVTLGDNIERTRVTNSGSLAVNIPTTNDGLKLVSNIKDIRYVLLRNWTTNEIEMYDLLAPPTLQNKEDLFPTTFQTKGKNELYILCSLDTTIPVSTEGIDLSKIKSKPWSQNDPIFKSLKELRTNT